MAKRTKEKFVSDWLYNDYSSYLRNKYGTKVYRIGIDAGFTCPNRDGKSGTGGCIYCDAAGSRAAYANPQKTVHDQIETRIKFLKDTKSASKFIAYFQAFTNTYAPVEKLRSIYDTVKDFQDIVGLSIGTRPDAVDREKLELIASYTDRYDVWIEYGLQSIHNKTLETIRRGHNYDAFLKSYQMTKECGIKVCVHVILGLPGESREDMMATAKTLTKLKVDGVKIHLLHVLKGSGLDKLHSEGRIKLLEQSEYVKLAAEFLEHLSKDIIIQRLTGEGSKDSHIAPVWALDKMGTISQIGEELKRKGSRQGKLVAH